ncbi:MAG: 2-polyprenyl-3-methyl-6-methoxy-1,4-benzoquinone monooxygenase [Gammaproteobacteria bacterium]|nr:2-polyprenyl-3-methyl-6-methoxy-1,4-benzoquinone monooxygenase [Gammaproteobacteria bacterium]
MNSRDYNALDHLIMGFEKVKGVASGDSLPDWIPACAGMTKGDAGMTNEDKGMTREDDGITKDADRVRSAALMRVNHAGEVAAQALYAGHAVAARDARVRDAMLQAAAEEGEHLDWCETRVRELDSHVSYLTPLWYFGSFAIGAATGAAGDKWSLGFVMETERQVVEHLDRHLELLPEQDRRSRSILQQMRRDEMQHASVARDAGGAELPLPLRALMRCCSKVMTGTAYWV